jgi:hypothetical protein
VPATIFKDDDLRQSIIGLSPICHNGQEILLTETTLNIIKNGEIILRTYKNPMDKLWNFPSVHDCLNKIGQQPAQTVANVIKNEIDAAYVVFMSATMGSPPDSTLINALDKGWCGNLPRLTAKMVR